PRCGLATTPTASRRSATSTGSSWRSPSRPSEPVPARAPRACPRTPCRHFRPCPVHDVRPSARERGYDGEWETGMRAEVLAEEPWCRDHLAKGEYVRSTDVHNLT